MDSPLSGDNQSESSATRKEGTLSGTAQKEQTIGQYKLGKTIGEGTFGKVKIGVHTLTQEKVMRNFQSHRSLSKF